MKAKVIKVGDETAVVLPHEAVAKLALKEGQRLHARWLADGGIRIGPADSRHDKAMRIAEDVMVEYAETFKALAKS